VRAVAAVVALTLLGACTANTDRYRPTFGARETVATTNGPVTFTLAPNGRIYFAELRTNAIQYLDHDNAAHAVVTPADKPDSLAVDTDGTLFVAARNLRHRLSVTRYDDGAATVIWEGNVSTFAAHIALGPDGRLLVGWHTRLFSLDPRGRVGQTPQLISDGYTDPVFVVGRGNRIWVADNASPGDKERVVRGREKSEDKRNRFGSVLPAYTNPSSAVLVKDEVLLCSKTHRKLYRLHIGLDDVARRRGMLAGLVCERDIALRADGSLITTQRGVIYRYPPA
jgi:hypothetical protein